jgi:hypothetical protein
MEQVVLVCLDRSYSRNRHHFQLDWEQYMLQEHLTEERVRVLLLEIRRPKRDPLVQGEEVDNVVELGEEVDIVVVLEDNHKVDHKHAVADTDPAPVALHSFVDRTGRAADAVVRMDRKYTDSLAAQMKRKDSTAVAKELELRNSDQVVVDVSSVHMHSMRGKHPQMMPMDPVAAVVEHRQNFVVSQKIHMQVV